jgi:RNA polymerase sigma-70 factor (ECF subfamily)
VAVTKRPTVHLSDGGGSPARPDEYVGLVRRAAAGDAAAMEDLLVRAQEVAYRFSLMVCGHADDAEDVMQEALIKTYRRVGTIKDPSAFRTWLFRTVRNACLMKRRKRVDEPSRVESLDASHDQATTARNPADAAINSWLGAQLRRALFALPPQYRMIVMLRDMEGLSTREAAKVSGMTEDNVKTRLHRARVLLRDALSAGHVS